MIFNVCFPFFLSLYRYSKNENIFATSHVDSATTLEYGKYLWIVMYILRFM